MRAMLLSINPSHVENILLGKKQFEFRKVRCKNEVDRIIIYATAPIMQVVAEAMIEEVIIGGINEVWHMTKAFAGVSYNFYRRYYKGRRTAIAYKLGGVVEYPKPKLLTDFGITYPPQSFAYLSSIQ